jgi:membrane protein
MSWLEILRRTISEFQEDNLTDWAAALTYYGVLSLFPALIALVSIVGLVGDPEGTTKALSEFVTKLGPASAEDTFRGPIESITAHRSTAGVLLVSSLGVALWSASSYIGAFIRASNVIYEVHEGRPFWKLRPLQLLVTLVLILLLTLVSLALVATGPLAEALGDAIGASHTVVDVWDVAKWPVMLATVLLVLAILYYSSPNAKLPGFKWVTPGSLLAVLLWVVASAGFAFYVANFGSYDKTYGTLGGVVTFLIWLWISNVAVLLGAELNAEVERSRQLEGGVPGAERELQLRPRDEPEGPRTA